MKVSFTLVSKNVKTGPIPVSMTEHTSCPTACPLSGKNGCYAETGPMTWTWKKVADKGMVWNDFCNKVNKLPKRTLWRHNQAGDLPTLDRTVIDGDKIKMLVTANKGKRGFTYTHYDPSIAENAELITFMNKNGFTCNLSADNAQEADDLLALNIAPVVAIIPMDSGKVNYTPKGNKIVTCPAQTIDNVTCMTCGLCQKVDRDYIIGFMAHGARKKYVSSIATLAISE